MRIIFIFATLSTFVACGEKGSDADGADTGSTEDTNSDSLFDNTDPDEEVADGAPTISNADAWCYEVGGTTEGEQWGFKFSFDDPQGVETVPRLQMGSIQILNSSGVSTAALDAACNRDTQVCSANLFSTQVGTGCDAATTISVKYQIVDDDDNTSNSITIDGRVGEDFDG
jgi:hypothetical protein